MSARTAKNVIVLALVAVVAGLLACTNSDVPVPAATPDQPTATSQPAGISRDEAVQLAVELTRPLFDQLHSLGQYTTIVRAVSMSLRDFAMLVGDSERRLDDEAGDKQVWAVEIEIKLIGTPEGPEPTYSLVGIDAEDGGLELITTLQSPVLLAAGAR